MRDHSYGLRIMDAVDQRVRGKSSEHDRVRRSDASTRQHRDREFRSHAHVDRDAVAFLTPSDFKTLANFCTSRCSC